MLLQDMGVWVTHALFCVTHARCRFEFDMLSRELPEGNHSLEKRYQTTFWRGTAGALGLREMRELREWAIP